MKSLLIFLIIYLSCLTIATDWINIAPDAENTALAGATIAKQNNITGMYWNPANIPSKRSVSYSTFKIMGEINYNYVGFVLPTKLANMGFAYSGLADSGYQKSVYISGRPILTGETFQNNASCFSFSLAWDHEKYNTLLGFNYGVTTKMLSQSIDEYSANGFTMDFGLSKEILPGLRVAGVLYNAGGSMDWDNADSDPFITKTKAGINWELTKGLNIYIDQELRGYRTNNTSYGVEYLFGNMLALRGGSHGENTYAGVGLNLGELAIDCSYTLTAEDYIEDSFKYSISYSFQPAPSKKSIKKKITIPKKEDILVTPIVTELPSTTYKIVQNPKGFDISLNSTDDDALIINTTQLPGTINNISVLVDKQNVLTLSSKKFGDSLIIKLSYSNNRIIVKGFNHTGMKLLINEEHQKVGGYGKFYKKLFSQDLENNTFKISLQ